ncbi:MAG: cysteine desulfurase [Nanoarchaeota archaeon]|nr:cysteine desulfurase [Nanoarchaeota archaeon]
MNTSEATITHYKKDKRAKEDLLGNNVDDEIEKSVNVIVKDYGQFFPEVLRINNVLKDKGIICKIYEKKKDLKGKLPCQHCKSGVDFCSSKQIVSLKTGNQKCGEDCEIYLDHSATTYVDSRVFEAMKPYFMEEYGNPSSFNSVGMRAKEVLDNCRARVAELIDAKYREIIFTGSGTESVNLAIQGIARAWKSSGRKGKAHIITNQTEHHAVLDTCEYLAKEEGFDVTYLKPDKYGVINAEMVKKALRKNTILVTIMYANNEVGTVNPIARIAEVVKKFRKENANSVVFHTDACQAGGILDINVEKLGVDLMTINGSKLYGPKGTGMLFVRSGVEIKPLMFGGGQEFGLRSSTENVPGIVGFTKALELAQESRVKESERLIKLRDDMIARILKNVPDTVLNGHPIDRLPNNVNISFLNVEGESLLLHLNEKGVCASSGSACTSKSLEPSHVLVSMGLPYELAHGSIRFSLGKKTTKNDIDTVVKMLPKIVETLRIISPFKGKLEK